jgi:hypothetical protein
LESIARTWLRNDLAAAQAWLAKSSLPFDQQQKLIADAQKNSGD